MIRYAPAPPPHPHHTPPPSLVKTVIITLDLDQKNNVR